VTFQQRSCTNFWPKFICCYTRIPPTQQNLQTWNCRAMWKK